MKRQNAPTFWNIRRKESQFVINIKPGPHPKKKAYALGMMLRDLLRVVVTMREAEIVLKGGKVKIDGVIRHDTTYPVGLMDMVELSSGQTYRMVPSNSDLLVALPVEDSEKNQKLAKVTSKVTIHGKKIQYGFHDGRTMISHENVRVGDTCVLKLPEGTIDNRIEFAKGNTALIITGENAGRVGRIEDIKDGIFSLPKRALVSFGERSVELPVEMVMVVGSDKPVLRVN